MMMLMIARILALSGLPFFTVLVIEAAAQTHPDPDSLVAAFIADGPIHNIGPGRLFDGCPDLSEWQERGFRLLLSAELTPEREGQLAAAWHYALDNCGHPDLEQWYIASIRRLFSRGINPSPLHWWAVRSTDSPTVVEILAATMEDGTLDPRFRTEAGFSYFHRLSGVERRDAYLEFFARLSLPEQVAWGVTTTLLRENADQLLERVGEIVRLRPELADQPAFATIVQSTSGSPSEQALRAFAESVREAAARAPAGGLRDRLRSAAAHVERRSQEGARRP